MKVFLLALVAFNSLTAFASSNKVQIVDRRTKHAINVECVEAGCLSVNLIETAREGFSRVINKSPVSKAEFRSKIAPLILFAARNDVSFKNSILENIKSGWYDARDIEDAIMLGIMFPLTELPVLIADSVYDITTAPVKLIDNGIRNSKLTNCLKNVDDEYGAEGRGGNNATITHKAYERIILALSLL